LNLGISDEEAAGDQKKHFLFACQSRGSSDAEKSRIPKNSDSVATAMQGCQILLDTMYQNEGKCTKLPLIYQTAIHTIFKRLEYIQNGNTNLFHSKMVQNLPKLGFLV
jgi:hypothetical protein